jgi:hypothetical protein
MPARECDSGEIAFRVPARSGLAAAIAPRRPRLANSTFGSVRDAREDGVQVNSPISAYGFRAALANRIENGYPRRTATIDFGSPANRSITILASGNRFRNSFGERRRISFSLASTSCGVGRVIMPQTVPLRET